MKNFQEFVETITPEDYRTIMLSAEQAMITSGKKMNMLFPSLFILNCLSVIITGFSLIDFRWRIRRKSVCAFSI